jgi:hypothetical protein
VIGTFCHGQQQNAKCQLPDVPALVR